MEARWSWRAARIALALTACAPGLWQLSLQLRLFFSRFRYPWDIEWLEGATLYQAYRVMRGQPTYGPPSLGYLPLFHPPGYPGFLGIMGHLIGVDYATARSLSMLFFLGAAAVILRELLLHEESRDRWVTGTLAVGSAAAGAQLCEGVYDLVREDMMALFLCVLCAALAQREKPRPRRLALLSLLVGAALYTRLPCVFLLIWIVLYVFVRNRRAGVLLMLGSISVCGLVLVALQYTSRGWFWIYTVGLLQDHPLERAQFWVGARMIVRFAPFLLALPIAVVALAVKRSLRPRTVLWVGMLVAAIPAALLPLAKVGGFANDLVPVAFLAGPATVFVAADVVRALRQRPRAALAVRDFFYAGFGIFLVLRTYDFSHWVPIPDAWRRARSTNDRIARLEGGVIVPRHPFVPIQDGHRTTRQLADMPYLDATWSGLKGLELGAYLDSINAEYAVLSGTEVPITGAEIAARYQLDTAIAPAPAMVIGEGSTLRYLFRWRDEEKEGKTLFDFERPLQDWTATGFAFDHSPTTAKPKGQSPISGVIGSKLANSFHPEQGDSATGTLVSPPFVIDRPRIGLRVGGGWHSGTRVELRIGERPVRTASGIFEYHEILTHVVWDVSRLVGKEAQIALVDEDIGPWGHLLCDRIVAY